MSLVFNGTSNFATGALKTAIQMSGGSFTVAGTVYVNALPSATADIFSTSSSSTFRGVGLRLLSTGQVLARASFGGTTTQTSTGFYVVPGQTYKFAIVKTGSTSYFLYVDKSSTSITQTATESSSTIDTMYLGETPGGSNFFNGSVVDIAVWTSALSSGDLDIILDPYKKPTDISTAPQDYWPAVSADTASTSGTGALSRTGATYDAATLIPPITTSTVVLGNSIDANYTVSTYTYTATNGEYFLKFTATNSGTMYYLCANFPQWSGAIYLKMSLRNSAGALLATGTISSGAKGHRRVLITPTIINSGSDYYITFGVNASSCYLYANSTTNVVRSDSTSTYATPATNLNLNGSTVAVGTPQVWLEGIGNIPNTMSFPSVLNHIRNVVVTSNTVTIAGLDSGTSVPISISGGTYSKNGGAYTSSPDTVQTGDTLTLRTTVSSSYATTTNVTLTAAGIATVFTCATERLNNIYINSWTHNSASPIFDGAFVTGGH